MRIPGDRVVIATQFGWDFRDGLRTRRHPAVRAGAG
jgi:hypothetical protein